MHLPQMPDHFTGIICYNDTSLTPDSLGLNLRDAGLGIMFVNMQVHPPNTLYIKAIMKDVSSVIMVEAGALAQE